MTTVTRSTGRQPAPHAVLAIAGAAVALLLAGVASELALPALAASRLRAGLSENATDVRVEVSARPAVRLLLGHADRVEVRIGELRSSGQGSVADLLSRTRAVSRLDVHVDRLLVHGLRVDDLSLRKRGGALMARASVSRAAIRSALPRAVVIDERATGVNRLAFTVTVRTLGRTVSATALVRADRGRVAIQPALGKAQALGGVLQISLFDDPRISVDAIRSSGARGGRYDFAARGHLTSED